MGARNSLTFLILTLLLVQAGLARQAGAAGNVPSPKTSVLVLYDTTEEYGMYCYEQTLISLRYARIPYRSYNLALSQELPALDSYSSILITTETVWKLSDAACGILTRYVSEGGGVAVLFRGWNQKLEDLFGIQVSTAPTVIGARSRGLKFTREFLPGLNDLLISDRLLADISRFDVQLDSTVTVFATTSVGEYPAAWVRRYGKGKVLYWDTSLLTTRIYRGFILASIGCVQPWTSALILNLSNVCLDDFPLPSPNEKVEPIRTEFNETASEFYSLRWMPDMEKLARQFNLHLTAGLIFNYLERTDPPYRYTEWSRSQIMLAGKPLNSSVWMARQASRTMELAFHGHNHQPLTIGRWGTRDDIVGALQAAKHRWGMDNLGPEPVSYIPPMNIIDSVGMSALVEVFPKVRVIGGQFMGKFELGQAREFGPDPWNSKLIDAPRTTSGYVMDEFNKMMTISMIHTFGVWNHFVHPDDVFPTLGRYQESVREDENVDIAGWYDAPKNDGLFYRFESWLRFMHDKYPWLRHLSLKETPDVVKRFSAASATVSSNETTVQFASALPPAYYMLYLGDDNKVTGISGGEILHQEELEFSTICVLKADGPEMSVTLKNPVPAATMSGEPQGDLYTVTRWGREDLRPATPSEVALALPPPTPKTMLEEAEALVAGGNQKGAIKLLEEGLRGAPNDVAGWKKLGQLYDWNNQPDKAIKAAESLVRLAPKDVNLLRDLAQRYVGANRQREAIPVYERILRIDPKDTGTMKSLAQNYVWANRQKDAIALYDKLVKREPSNVDLRRTLADLCFWNSLNEQGISQYEQILRMQKSDTATMRTLAEKYLEVNRQADAIRMLESLLSYQQTNSSLRKQLAQLYVWNAAPLKAIGQYELIVKANDADRDARKTLGRMYLENSMTDQAIPVFEKICSDEPNDIGALKQLGQMYLWKERQSDAVPVYRRIVQAEPDSASSRLMLGRLLMWTKDPAGATMEFENVLRKDPRNKEALALVAELERGEGNWIDSRTHYERLLAQDPANHDARTALADIRREHGLLLRTSYERTEDSNDLVREQVPLGAGMISGERWNMGIQAVRQNILDRRRSATETGYGLGWSGQYYASRSTTFSGTILATTYDSKWTPLSVSLQMDNALSPRVSSSIHLQRFETTEGVQAITNQIYVNKVAAEVYYQTTERFSISAAGDVESYSDDNNKSTAATFLTYKIRLGAPLVMLLANYAYQDSKNIYRTSVPYWTPSRLSTSSVGIDLSQSIFESVSAEAAYLHTLQAGVFSGNVRARLTVLPSMFSQIALEYEKLGSTVYSQNTFRAILQYRY
ncbi:MAG TPA: DUF2194 domain-containing protein [Bacteroidota bacterium]|nr:DUF2194 domain-containing protein [Bacteroidota bacterium]